MRAKHIQLLLLPKFLMKHWKQSYNPSNVAGSWYPQYTGAFITGAAGVFQQAFIAAKGQGQSDADAMAFAQSAVGKAASEFHKAARGFCRQRAAGARNIAVQSNLRPGKKNSNSERRTLRREITTVDGGGTIQFLRQNKIR